MRKGIIVEINHDQAVVLNDRGAFDRIKSNANMNIGAEIEYGDHTNQKILATFCLLVLMVGGVFGFDFYQKEITPVSYVAVDINPGVEFTLNIHDKVISAHATNTDGKYVLAGMEVVGNQVEEAIRAFVDEACDLGYISEAKEQNAVLVSVVNDDAGKVLTLENSLVEQVNDVFLNRQILGVVLTDEADVVMRSEAEQAGLSTGKYRLAKEVAQNSDVSEEEAAKLSVADLNKIVKENNPVVIENEEQLIANKEEVKANTVEPSKAEEPSAFGGVLEKYQRSMTPEVKQNIWNEVNTALSKAEPKQCTNLETGEVSACPIDIEPCYDAQKKIYFVCPVDKDICVDQKEGYRFVCPVDKAICTDETTGNKFVCPFQAPKPAKDTTENKTPVVDKSGKEITEKENSKAEIPAEEATENKGESQNETKE